MEKLIADLVQLQAIEVEGAKLARQMAALPAEVVAVEAEVAALVKRTAKAKQTLQKEELLRTDHEKMATELRTKIERFRAQMDTVTNAAQAEAIEHELHFVESEVARLENEQLASLAKSDALETELAAIGKQMAERTASLETVRQSVAGRRQELETLEADRQSRRNALRVQIDPEWLTRFDRLIVSRGTAIAEATNQQCTGCQMGSRLQLWSNLRDEKLLNCDSCGRMLYWDPAMAPAAPSPAAVPKPATSRAVRRPRQSKS